jgi:tetratricopeptide (TPR) repeat protein
MINLASAHQSKRDFDVAESYHHQALALARGTNSTRLAALSLVSLASVHDQRNQSDAVIREATEALEYYQKNAFTTEAYQCLRAIGRAHMKRGDTDTALDVFQRALAASEKIEDGSQAASAEEDIGLALAVLQRYPEALSHFEKELAVSRTSEERGYAGFHLGRTLWVLGRYKEAFPVLDAAEANAAPYFSLRLSLLRERATLALSQGRFIEAASVARKALSEDTGQNAGTNAELSRIIGLALLSSGSVREGVKYCRESLVVAEKLDSPARLMEARLAMEQAFVKTGDRVAALQIFHESEAVLTKYPEFRWRMLALVSLIDPKQAPAARSALTDLSRAWGEQTFKLYLNRPDVAHLARPLLQTDHAIQNRRDL